MKQEVSQAWTTGPMSLVLQGANVPLGYFSSLLFSPTLVTGPIIRHIIDLLFNSVSININSILCIPGLMQVVVEKYIINNGSIAYLFFQQIFIEQVVCC